jgi:uncharacterized protein (UPF0335 family)
LSERILRLHVKRHALDEEIASVYAEAKRQGIRNEVRAEVNRRREAAP